MLLLKLIRCLAQSLKSVSFRLELRQLISELARDLFPPQTFCVELILEHLDHGLLLLEGLSYKAVQAYVSISAPAQHVQYPRLVVASL